MMVLMDTVALYMTIAENEWAAQAAQAAQFSVEVEASELVERLGLLRAMLQVHQPHLREKLDLVAVQKLEILLQAQVEAVALPLLEEAEV